METCPHGARITCAVGEPVRFVDECTVCEALLEELGFDARVVQREAVLSA